MTPAPVSDLLAAPWQRLPAQNKSTALPIHTMSSDHNRLSLFPLAESVCCHSSPPLWLGRPLLMLLNFWKLHQSNNTQGSRTHHELDIVGKDCLYALNHRLWRQVVCDIGHAPWVACVECGGRLVPWGFIVMLHRERLNLKTHNASQVGGGILVVQDCEPQVVVQEEFDLALALQWRQEGGKGGRWFGECALCCTPIAFFVLLCELLYR